MALWPLAWITGAGLQMQLDSVGPAWLQASLAIAALVVWLALARLRRLPRALVTGAGALAIAAAAFASTDWRAAQRLAERLPADLQGRDLTLVGTVAQLAQSNLAGTRFVLAVESATLRGEVVRVPPRVSLGWYHGADADEPLLGPGDVRAGQRWRFTARLRQPHGSLNPHGFDVELWMFEQGLGASGYVRSRPGDAAVLLDEQAAHPVQRLRQRLRDRIDAAVDDAAAAGVLAALAIGDQGAIDRADWEVFRVTGVAHLMSISGLHVTMFAWLAAALVGRAWRGSARLTRWLPAPTAGRWAGLALAAGYALLAGWGVPAQRTVLMIATVVLLRSLALRWPALLRLAPAGLVVTVVDPWALLQPGFWLSFVAVGLLVASDGGRFTEADAGPAWPQRLTAAVRSGLRTQAVATVGLAPLTLVFFQQVSLVGLAANLVAIPLVTLLITPLALLGCLLGAAWLPAAALVSALLWGLGQAASWPWAQWLTPAAPAWAAVLGLAGGALLVLPLPWRLRAAGAAMVLPLLAPTVARPEPGRFELVALDVGQGTTVLVRTARHLLVYDAGPQYSLESDAGQRLLVPLLRARGESRVDRLVLSHRDADHVGGAASLIARVPVTRMSSSLDESHPLRAAAVPHEPCRAGQRWQWDGVDFEILHPDPHTAAAAGRPNTVSCVLQVRGAQGAALLAGDIERAQELALVERLGAALRSEVLLVPHHGSRTSSTPAFVDAVSPRVAVVQAGYRSRFGHPAADVVERYARRGVTVVRTDACGAWTWAADGSEHCERRRAARYWHHAGGDGPGR